MKNIAAIAILAGIFAWVWFNYVKKADKPATADQPTTGLPKYVQSGIIGSVYKRSPTISAGIVKGPCIGLQGTALETCLGSRANSNEIPNNSNSITLGV